MIFVLRLSMDERKQNLRVVEKSHVREHGFMSFWASSYASFKGKVQNPMPARADCGPERGRILYLLRDVGLLFISRRKSINIVIYWFAAALLDAVPLCTAYFGARRAPISHQYLSIFSTVIAIWSRKC